MAHEFKPGDLALIVASESLPSCIGTVVTLRYGLRVVKVAGVWEVSDSGEPAWIVSGNSVPEGAGCVECHLMPLKGDEQPAQLRQAERVQ